MGKGGAHGRASITPTDWAAKLAAARVSKAETDALVMDYFVTEGYIGAAESFAHESGIPPPTGLASIERRTAIRSAIMRGDVERAIEQANDLDPELLEGNPGLFFALQQQRLVEAVRAGDPDLALELAQDCLAPLGEERPEFLPELERTAALLLFDDPSDSPLADLADPRHRATVAGRLNAAVLASQNLPRAARIPAFLPLLFWLQDRLFDTVDFPRILDVVAGDVGDAGASP